jgi:hypothetical protein
MIFREQSSNNIRIKVFSILKLARLCLRYVLFFWCDFLLILTALSLVGGQSQYMAVGLSSPLSKSSFILFYSWCFLHPKSSIGRKPRVRFFECVFFIYQRPQT